jgi:hypothetical protein
MDSPLHFFCVCVLIWNHMTLLCKGHMGISNQSHFYRNYSSFKLRNVWLLYYCLYFSLMVKKNVILSILVFYSLSRKNINFDSVVWSWFPETRSTCFHGNQHLGNIYDRFCPLKSQQRSIIYPQYQYQKRN